MKLLFVVPSDKDKLGSMIKKFGKLATGDAKVSHVAIVIGRYVYETHMFVGVTRKIYSDAYKNIPHELWSVSKTQMPLYNEKMLTRWFDGQIGKWYNGYGMLKIPMQALDAVVSKIAKKRVFPFTSIFAIKYFPICSSLVSYALYKFGALALRELFEKWRNYSPDDMHDIVSKSKLFKKHG